MTDLPKAYNPHDIEERLYSSWEEQGLFRAEPTTERESFCIVIPPPNVTGALHVGHALNNSLQDVLTRRARMQGLEALWQPGTDHAGIATQNVVERELRKEGLSRHDLGREAFVEKVWEWKEQYGSRIIHQLKRLGCSCDWERLRFTMDEGLSRAVRTIFVRWYDDGLIYRGNRIINWCLRCETALSDIEVDHKDTPGELITFRYELTDGSGSISVATTRVETMLGDTGIAVHPADDRYKDLVGKKVRHPFFSDRDVPIVADDDVDPEFGSGAVKVTPAHDPTDFDIGERHGLEQINIFDERAQTNSNAGEFADMDRYEARQVVLKRLEELDLVEKEERPYVHPVGHCSRCGTEVEPWLSEQWFVKMKPLAEPAIAAVKDGRISLEPKRFVKQYVDWMENIRDWCISRQLWWGHRIPVWYCENGHTFAALEDPTACKECGSEAIEQDPDVLDTWFSSQLWPFSTLGWPDDDPYLEFFYPTTVMVTAYDILFFWVARMIMSGLYAMDDVPFKEVFLTGLVRDFEGKKMSKSLGNVIDPLEVIDQYGADALRFAIAFATVPGNNTNLSEERTEGARNFANKLWNATRFVLRSIGDERPELERAEGLALPDRWILSRLDHTIEEVDRWYATYNFGEVSRLLYQFIWTEFCDWYIELAKLELNAGHAESTKAVLVHVLDHVLRMLHPIMPFVTEELWLNLRPQDGSIMKASWVASANRYDKDAEQVMDLFQQIVTGLRRMKVDHEIPQAARVTVTAAPGREDLAALEQAFVGLARLDEIRWVDSTKDAHGFRTITEGGVELVMEPPGDFSMDVERDRLKRLVGEAASEIKRAEGKLANESFVSRAPKDVVEKEQAKLEEWKSKREKLEAELSNLS